MDEDTKAFWMKVYPDLRRDKPDFAGALTARGTSIVLRLTLIYALLDKSKTIGAEHLEAALAVWKYNEESAQILFRNKSENSLTDQFYSLLSSQPMMTSFKVTLVSKATALGLAMKHVGVEKHQVQHELTVDWNRLYEDSRNEPDPIESRIAEDD